MNILVVNAPTALADELQSLLPYPLRRAAQAEIMQHATWASALVVVCKESKVQLKEALQKLKEANPRCITIVSSPDTSLANKIAWLTTGADDVLPWPIDAQEVVAHLRIRVGRNMAKIKSLNIEIADLVMDLEYKRATRQGSELGLTKNEFKLLELFILHLNKTVSAETIADALWKDEAPRTKNAVEAAIERLREKIDKPFDKKLIHTRRGFGYELRVL